MRLEEIFFTASPVKAVEGVERDRLRRQGDAVRAEMHMAGEPALQEPFSLCTLRELQTLDGHKTIDLLQQFWQFRHIFDGKIRLAPRQQLAGLCRARPVS